MNTTELLNTYTPLMVNGVELRQRAKVLREKGLNIEAMFLLLGIFEAALDVGLSILTHIAENECKTTSVNFTALNKNLTLTKYVDYLDAFGLKPDMVTRLRRVVKLRNSQAAHNLHRKRIAELDKDFARQFEEIDSTINDFLDLVSDLYMKHSGITQEEVNSAIKSGINQAN